PTIAMEMLLLLICDANLTNVPDCDAFPNLGTIVAADDADHSDGLNPFVHPLHQCNPRHTLVVTTYHPPRTPEERCRVCCRAAHILNKQPAPRRRQQLPDRGATRRWHVHD